MINILHGITLPESKDMELESFGSAAERCKVDESTIRGAVSTGKIRKVKRSRKSKVYVADVNAWQTARINDVKHKPGFMSVSDAAKVLGISPVRVRQLITSSDLEACRQLDGRSWSVSRSSVDKRRNKA